MTQQEDEVRAQRAQRHERLVALAERLNGGAVMRDYLGTRGFAEDQGFDALQFERWLLGVMRRSEPALVGTYDPAKVQITIGAPVDADGNPAGFTFAGSYTLTASADGFTEFKRVEARLLTNEEPVGK